MSNLIEETAQMQKLKNMMAFAYGADSEIYLSFLMGKDVFAELQVEEKQVSNSDVLAVNNMDELRLLKERIKREQLKAEVHQLYYDLIYSKKDNIQLSICDDSLKKL